MTTKTTSENERSLPQLPATFIRAGNTSISERKDVIKVYNQTVTNLSNTDLPKVKFNFRSEKTNRTGLSKHKHGFKPWKNRPIFTEGLSSHSTKHEPVFYVKSSSVVSCNLPHGIHYSRDKSKIVLETKSRSERRTGATSLPIYPDQGSKPTSRLSHAQKTSKSLTLSKNYTLLLPKVHIEKEISIIDYVRSGFHSARENVQFVPIIRTVDESDTKSKPEVKIQAENSDDTRSGRVKLPLPKETFDREPSFVTSVSSKSRNDLHSRKGSRMNAEDIHKVSVGEDVDFSFLRSYGSRVPAAPVSEYELEHQKSFESRAALSTPGKGKHRQNIKHAELYKSFDSKSVPSFSFKKPKTKGIMWEELGPKDDQSEANDVMGASYDSRKVKSNVIKKYTIGDPLKDSNMQDKKLDKSRLIDLYSRGVVRNHVINTKAPRQTDRVTVQMLKRDDRNGRFGGSRASGISTLPGNPPPSIATYLAAPGHEADGKAHHPLLSPEHSHLSQAFCVEGANVTMSPEHKAPKNKGRLLIDGNLLNLIEREKEKDVIGTLIDKYEQDCFNQT